MEGGEISRAGQMTGDVDRRTVDSRPTQTRGRGKGEGKHTGIEIKI
jgi:hypothetical protein